MTLLEQFEINREEGREEIRDIVINNLSQKGYSKDEIAEILEIPVSEIK